MCCRYVHNLMLLKTCMIHSASARVGSSWSPESSLRGPVRSCILRRGSRFTPRGLQSPDHEISGILNNGHPGHGWWRPRGSVRGSLRQGHMLLLQYLTLNIQSQIYIIFLYCSAASRPCLWRCCWSCSSHRLPWGVPDPHPLLQMEERRPQHTRTGPRQGYKLCPHNFLFLPTVKVEGFLP